MDSTKPIVNEIQVGDSAIILNLEETIKTHIDSIARLKEEKKKHQEMFADGYLNNPVYRENNEKVKEASKARLVVKQQITSTPSMIAISQEIKGHARDIKERQVTLSDYLLEYERLTGATQLSLFDGTDVEIVKSAKVVRRSRKK